MVDTGQRDGVVDTGQRDGGKYDGDGVVDRGTVDRGTVDRAGSGGRRSKGGTVPPGVLTRWCGGPGGRGGNSRLHRVGSRRVHVPTSHRPTLGPAGAV